MMQTSIIGWVITASLTMATPLILAALGGMFSERSGIVNIGLEGMMLIGAFGAVLGSYYTNNPWIGVVIAVIAGGLLGAVHAIITVKLKGNHIVSGAGIILFGLGFTTLMLKVIWDVTGTSDRVTPLPPLIIPGFGPIQVLTILMFVLIPICYYLMYHTHFGLRLRASGEDPSTLDTAGVNVEKMRMYGVILSGMLAGLAGAHLSIGIGSAFSKNMTNGRGFIALAALIFGNWHPIGILIAGLFFGLLDGLQIYAQIFIPAWSAYSQFIQMIPYISVIVALGIIRRSIPPKAIGLPYIKELQH
jgi:ABC-type uncharacterized transport system permease subunit